LRWSVIGVLRKRIFYFIKQEQHEEKASYRTWKDYLKSLIGPFLKIGKNDYTEK
jgi:hypothetical protein